MTAVERMERVAAQRERLKVIREEMADLLGAGLPSEGAFAVSQCVALLDGIDEELEDALFDCGLIEEASA